MRIGDCLDHRQPQPAATALTRARAVAAQEGIEDLLTQRRIDAGTFVVDGDLYVGGGVVHGDADPAGRGVAPRILQQRHQRLADPGRVAMRRMLLA